LRLGELGVKLDLVGIGFESKMEEDKDEGEEAPFCFQEIM